MRPPSAKMLRVLAYFMAYARRHGYQPSYREAEAEIGTHHTAVFTKMSLLEQKGYVKLGGCDSRAVRFLRWPCGVEFRGMGDSAYTLDEHMQISGDLKDED